MMMRKPRRTQGFTLIEMLMVVIVISVLVGMVFPVIQGAIRNAERAGAKEEVKRLEAGIKLYRSLYDTYPGQAGAAEAVVDTSSDATLIPALTSQGDVASNPQRKVFFEPSRPKGQGCVDPWERGYKVVMDCNGDGRVTGPGGTNLVTAVAVWSEGPTSGTNTTVIGSWQ